MFETKSIVFAVIFGLICGVIAFVILSGDNKDSVMVLLESAVFALVGAGGYLYGKYNRERQGQKKSDTKMSKNQQKRMQKRK